jgi:hypothetical protein
VRALKGSSRLRLNLAGAKRMYLSDLWTNFDLIIIAVNKSNAVMLLNAIDCNYRIYAFFRGFSIEEFGQGLH